MMLRWTEHGTEHSRAMHKEQHLGSSQLTFGPSSELR